MLHVRERTRGEAFDIVSKVPPEDSGFTIGRDKLFSRIQIKRALVRAEVRKLFEIPTVVSEDAKSLESLLR